MTNYHAVLVDECGMEFGADCEANSHQEAWNHFAAEYPESRCVQVNDPDECAAREQRIYDYANAQYDDPGLDAWDAWDGRGESW